METDINQLGFISFYSPIVHDAAGSATARPEYNGMLAFAMAGRGQLLKTNIHDKPAINFSALLHAGTGRARFSDGHQQGFGTRRRDPMPPSADFKTARGYRLPGLRSMRRRVSRSPAPRARGDGTWTAGAAEPLANGE